MGQFVKKENITIIIGTYEKEGQTKNEYRTIGEIVSMIGDDGSPYQFGRLWGANGATEFKIFAQQDKNQAAAPQQAAPAPQHNQAPAAQQNAYQHAQGGYQQR